MQPLGSPFSVHASWLPAGALLVAHLSLSAYNDRSLIASVALAAITVGLYFVCTLAHGFVHIVSARAVGIRPGATRISVFGDVTAPGTAAPNRRGEIIATLAGPVASAVIAAAATLAAVVTSGTVADLLRVLAAANGGLAIVNLVPVLPLDAGRLVASRSRVSARLASFGGKVFALAAALVGAWLMAQGPALVQETAAGLWLVLVAVFVFTASGWKDYRSLSLPPLEAHTVGDWARPFAGRLDASAPAPASGGPYAVSDQGRLAGVLTEGRLREGEPAAELMVPWATGLGMPVDAPLTRALQRLSADATAVVVAVDREGVVRGVLDEDTVREHLRRT